MGRYTGHTEFKHNEPLTTGVLLTNLGTPDAPEPGALRRYLKQFLWDPRVVEVPRPLWWLILNAVILNIRPGRSAKAYAEIWGQDGSPLLWISTQLVEALTNPVTELLGGSSKLMLGMRYGSPSIRAALAQMYELGLKRLLVLPMYPQYSGSTTGSTFDAVAVELERWRWVPEFRFVGSYHDDPVYIDALAESVEESWRHTQPADILLMSFHGLPQRYLLQGDPYYCQCQATGRLLAERLGLPPERWRVVFQSRFGREPWLQPYCDQVLESLPKDGVKTVDVICPGFAVDCLETLEEVEIRYRELFEQAGGERFRYISCLNSSETHQRLVQHLIAQHTQGWRDSQEAGGIQALSERLRRAGEKGALA